jgi:hypothetical protein
MRFLSKYAKYIVSVQPQINESYATGHTKTIQRPIYAIFALDGVTGEERSLARAHFSFNGFYQNEDLVTIVEPDYRISLFDSEVAQRREGWSDEERLMVEAELIEKARLFPDDLLVIEEVRLTPPWPNYDSFSGAQPELLEKIHSDGYDYADVLAYERQAQNRPEVIAALERMLEEEPDTTPVMEETLVG